MQPPPESIVCVDCGETAHLVSVRGEEGRERVAVYRCSGCWDRWDVVIEAEPVEEVADAADATRVGPQPVLREGETTPSDQVGR